jgi:hypothetical protein
MYHACFTFIVKNEANSFTFNSVLFIMQRNSTCVILCIMLIATMGCQRKYWFRIKIDVPHSNKYSVKINIVNYSDSLLSKKFEDPAQSGCKRVKKERVL